jgi:hypothetical protein
MREVGVTACIGLTYQENQTLFSRQERLLYLSTGASGMATDAR